MARVKPRRDAKITARIMASVHSKDTKPELFVRTRLWSLGYRYRTHVTSVPGRPDIVFARRRVAIFIDGDFWHGNPREWKRRGRNRFEDMFPSRTAWWVAKIQRNIDRDRQVDRLLRAAGWRVLRFWESGVLRDLDGVARRIEKALKRAGSRACQQGQS